MKAAMRPAALPHCPPCLILAGGEGTRLRAVSGGLPKPLLKVGDRPFLEYLLLRLRQQGLRDVVLCTGYRGELFEQYFGDGAAWDLRIRYSRESEPLGTAGALREARSLTTSETLVVLNGDSWLDTDLDALRLSHLQHAAVATLALAWVSDTSRFGRVETGPAPDGRIVRFVEKGADGPGWINGGVYLLRRTLLEELPPGPCSLERDVFPAWVGRGLYGVPCPGRFLDIGVPEDYLRLAADPCAAFSPEKEMAW